MRCGALLALLCASASYAEGFQPVLGRACPGTMPADPKPASSSKTIHRQIQIGARIVPQGAQPPSPLIPISLAVLVQMLGVGITLSTLPLYLTQMGATANQLASVVSIFSAAQMVGCPLLVNLSSKVGRLTVLRACLAGNALASLITAAATGWREVACARALAGFTAASVPVAQVAIAEFMPPGKATSKALSRVASAASLGIICGPAAGGLVGELARSRLVKTRESKGGPCPLLCSLPAMCKILTI